MKLGELAAQLGATLQAIAKRRSQAWRGSRKQAPARSPSSQIRGMPRLQRRPGQAQCWSRPTFRKSLLRLSGCQIRTSPLPRRSLCSSRTGVSARSTSHRGHRSLCERRYRCAHRRLCCDWRGSPDWRWRRPAPTRRHLSWRHGGAQLLRSCSCDCPRGLSSGRQCHPSERRYRRRGWLRLRQTR